MFFSNLVLAGAALAGLVAAQQSPYVVDPASIDKDLRQAWCRSQVNKCPLICGGQASPNTCDQNTLMWVCSCTNGQMPNISDYSDTIPYYMCAEWQKRCVDNAPNDLARQTACHSVVCGARPVGAVAVVTTTSIVSRSSAASSGSAASSVASSGSGIRSSVASAASSVASAASSAASAAASAASSAASVASSAAAAASPSRAAADMLEFGNSYGTGAVAVGLLALFGLAL